MYFFSSIVAYHMWTQYNWFISFAGTPFKVILLNWLWKEKKGKTDLLGHTFTCVQCTWLQEKKSEWVCWADQAYAQDLLIWLKLSASILSSPKKKVLSRWRLQNMYWEVMYRFGQPILFHGKNIFIFETKKMKTIQKYTFLWVFFFFSQY